MWNFLTKAVNECLRLLMLRVKIIENNTVSSNVCLLEQQFKNNSPNRKKEKREGRVGRKERRSKQQD